MAAKAAWLLKIPEIRALLAEVTLPVIDRAIVERVFGLRRRQAIELMNRFGGYQAGRTLLIDRMRLVAELDKILAGDDYHQESARHEKLTDALAQFQRTRRAEEVRIVESRMGASTGAETSPRFPSPLIKPDVRIARIRLSDWLHRKLTNEAPVGLGEPARLAVPRTPRL